ALRRGRGIVFVVLGLVAVVVVRRRIRVALVGIRHLRYVHIADAGARRYNRSIERQAEAIAITSRYAQVAPRYRAAGKHAAVADVADAAVAVGHIVLDCYASGVARALVGDRDGEGDNVANVWRAVAYRLGQLQVCLLRRSGGAVFVVLGLVAVVVVWRAVRVALAGGCHLGYVRSEERRVGKVCRRGGWRSRSHKCRDA